MKIFINEVAVNLTDSQSLNGDEHFQLVLDGSDNQSLHPSMLHHSVLVQNSGPGHLDEILHLLSTNILNDLKSITLATNDYLALKIHLKSKYKVIKASGGLVKKGKKVLMIYRLKKWDLPKGKLKKREDPSDGAVREIQEECGVMVKPISKICSTWHTYTMNNKNILKKTTWYLMKNLDDSAMKPQHEEEIEEVRWLAPKDIYLALDQSYNSIHHVFDCYFKMSKLEQP